MGRSIEKGEWCWKGRSVDIGNGEEALLHRGILQISCVFFNSTVPESVCKVLYGSGCMYITRPASSYLSFFLHTYIFHEFYVILTFSVTILLPSELGVRMRSLYDPRRPHEEIAPPRNVGSESPEEGGRGSRKEKVLVREL